MSETYEKVIEILRSYLNNKPIQSGNSVDWQKVLYYIKIHNLQGICYVVLKRNNISEYKLLESDFLQISSHNIAVESEMQKVHHIFEQNNIKYCPVKGFSVKKCYPNPELRTMGDVDLLIDEQNRELSDKVLKNAGFEIDDFSSFNHVRNYKNKRLYLEIHTKLIHEKLFNNYDYKEYFKDAINHTVQINNCLYELKPDYHLLFLLMHMAKHFFGEGCGLRMIYDIPMFVNYYRKEIDWKYLEKELKKIHLYKFAQSIFSLCKEWFDLSSPFDNVHVDEELKTYIFDGGVFGFDNRNLGAVKLRREVSAKDKGFKRWVHKIGGVIKWLCPNGENMKERDIWFKNKPAILLPIAWVRRWIKAIFIRKGSIFKKIADITKGNKDAEMQIQLLKSIGLYEE